MPNLDNITNICVDCEISDELLKRARAKAMKNPNNRITPTERFSRDNIEGAEKLAMDAEYKWEIGETIKICFMEGDSQIREKVRLYGLEWTRYANIKFQFVDNLEDSDVRISFTPGASWSYIGMIASEAPKDKPTMNFGWLNANLPEDVYSRVILHEFGHMLGAIHEHQRPDIQIPWHKPKVYEYYSGSPNFWTEDDVEEKIFRIYRDSITQQSDGPDTQSIMLYPVPNELTIGNYEVGFNRTLSSKDKTFIQTVYPNNKHHLKLLSIECLEAKDFSALDEVHLYTQNEHIWSKNLVEGDKEDLSKISLKSFSPRIEIKLYEKPQSDILGREDYLGTIFAHDTQAAKGEASQDFYGVGTHYRIIYKVE